MEYQTPPPETVQELAKLARCAFTLEKRPDGSEYWTANRCAPEWIGELVRTGHGGTGPGGMLPEDYRYQFIVEALDALEEAEDPDEARDGYEYEHRNYQLALWLGSHGRRFEYCDDWASEYGYELNNAEGGDTVGLLQGGQLYERLEVLDLVRGSLEAHLETLAAV